MGDVKTMATAPKDGSEVTLLLLVPSRARWSDERQAWSVIAPERDINQAKPIGWQPTDDHHG